MAWNNSHSWLSRKISFLKKHFIKAHASVRLFPVAVHISQDCSLWRQKRIQRWQESHPACICPNHQLCFWFSCSLDCQLQHSEQGRVVLKMLCKQRERKTNHSGARAAWSGKAPGILMEREVFGVSSTHRSETAWEGGEMNRALPVKLGDFSFLILEQNHNLSLYLPLKLCETSLIKSFSLLCLL